MSYDIFISYRREGGDTLAQLIYDRLTDRGYRVFLDIESLRSGKFNEKLLSVIEECKDVVVILPPGGLDRCSNEDDWVYLELSHAIKTGKNILPVMMKGFVWPDKLPENLRELPDFNGIQDSKDYFDAVIDKMTSLLRSRPVMFHKFRKTQKKYDFREQIARRKKTILFVLCCFLAIAAGMGAVCWKKYEKRKQMAENVSIVLSASDKMSAAEYYDAIDILKERMEILAGDSNYSMDVQKDEIDLLIPLECFGGIDIQEYLRAYLSRAMKLYLRDQESDRILEIRSENIEKLEYQEGSVDGLVLTEYFSSYTIEKNPSLAEMDSYHYFELTFTEGFQQTIREIFGTDTDSLILSQDVEENPDNYYYYQLFTGKSGDFYFIDNYQDDTLAELILHNYTSEPMPYSFYFDILLPVEWEYPKELKECGVNQCNEEQIKDPCVILQYQPADDLTEGNEKDAFAVFRKRLDTLETPYALGHTVSAEHGITVKVAPDRLNQEMLEWLGVSSNSISVQNKFYPSVTLEKGSFSFEKKEESYLLSASISSYSVDEWKTTVEQVLESENTDFYLGMTDQIVARCTEESVKESVDTGKVYLDQLTVWGMDEITEEYRYLLDFLEELFNGQTMPSRFWMENIRYEGVENSENAFPLVSSVSVEQERLEKEITQICPSAQVRLSEEGYLTVWLGLEKEELPPETLLSLIRQIYEIIDFSHNTWCRNLYIRGDQDNTTGFFLNTDRYETHRMVYEFVFPKDSFPEEYGEEFDGLLKEDPFFTETIIPDESGY